MRHWQILLFSIIIVSCHKDKSPPDLELKSGPGYTTSDIVVSPGTAFVVGINAYSGADDLNLFYTEVAFDGANTTKLVSRVWMNSDEHKHFVRDVTVTTRTQAGTERWVFDINDADGRISKKEIKVTVQ
ncbi:MAG: hypothetical protein HY064_15995 [Bacteroidetes bacterium]|nr:hypothetical protein [Bacteroidota bacterium]